MQSLPESHGRAEVGQGMKVPVLFFKDFLSGQDHLGFSGGRLGGLKHRGIKSFIGKSSMKEPYFFTLEIWEGKDLSPRHETHLS